MPLAKTQNLDSRTSIGGEYNEFSWEWIGRDLLAGQSECLLEIEQNRRHSLGVMKILLQWSFGLWLICFTVWGKITGFAGQVAVIVFVF